MMSIDYSLMSIEQTLTRMDCRDLYFIWNNINVEIKNCLEITGQTLPPQWPLMEFSREVLGEEAMHDLAYLSNVFSDLSMYGIQSWYWTPAFDLLTLINSCSGIG